MLTIEINSQLLEAMLQVLDLFSKLSDTKFSISGTHPNFRDINDNFRKIANHEENIGLPIFGTPNKRNWNVMPSIQVEIQR